MDKGNYNGLKLTEHCLKVTEMIIDKTARDIVNISDMQFEGR